MIYQLLTLSMLGNFSSFCCRLLTFFKINSFKEFVQEHYHRDKQFGSRSGSKLFAIVISRQQNLLLARIEFSALSGFQLTTTIYHKSQTPNQTCQTLCWEDRLNYPSQRNYIRIFSIKPSPSSKVSYFLSLCKHTPICLISEFDPGPVPYFYGHSPTFH